MRFVGDNETPKDTATLYTFLVTEVKQVMQTACAGSTRSCCRLIDGLLSDFSSDFTVDPETTLGRVFLYALCWSIGGLLEEEGRKKLDAWLRDVDAAGDTELMPVVGEGETIFEYFVNSETGEWQKWQAPSWNYPEMEEEREA